MRKQKTAWLLFLIVVLLFTMVSFVSAQKKVVKRDAPITVERNVADYTKPGGIVIGPAMPRAFHYGGRHSARTSDGILHVTWEDPTYNFPYYAHSTDPLGIKWTEPMDIPGSIDGFENWSRSLMAKLAIDPTNDDIYLMPASRVLGGVWRTQLTRSTDGGATWTDFMDLGNKINIPTSEVSWGTFAIGTDRVLHITFAMQNQDMLYTKTDLSLADGQADLEALVFTKSDGTPGAEAKSFVPSGVVFQGTIILDRNNDPHIIFSGDGGSDTFGDKTPYHIYYKTAAQAWGPIPPTRLQDELEQCWGMPEMVFDKNNRGYYFMDGNGDGIYFGTWEPPADPNSATDFGTLNNGQGPEAAVSLSTDTYPDVEVTTDNNAYLPNADVDDENDVVYLVASTGGFNDATGAGGDIFALKLENASTLGNVGPADMPWKLHRWVTKDGESPLGDVGPDVVYDPASTNLDIFWSGAGALNNEANYLDGTAVIPAIDAKPQTLDIGKTVDNPINKNETIVIKGTVKNSGTSPLGQVPVTVTITDSNDVILWEKTQKTPPLLADQLSIELTFGEWTVPDEKQNYSVKLVTSYPGDEAAYNDAVAAGFYAFPALDEVSYVEIFQDSTYWYTFANGTGAGMFPTTYSGGVLYEEQNVGGWTVYDSTHTDASPYLNTWYLSDSDVSDDLGGYIRHLSGTTLDTDSLYGDMPTNTPALPQNEILMSPDIDVSGLGWEDKKVYLEFTSDIDGTDGDDNYPIYAFVQVAADNGEWQSIKEMAKTVPGGIEAINYFEQLESFDITDLVAGASTMKVRYWWRSMNNSGEFGVWWVDNVTVIEREVPPDAIEDNLNVAKTFKLSQNYPNPFNPTTEISYTLPESGKVKLIIYNVTGQQVATLVNAWVKSGTHKVTFNASELPTGVYFYKLTTEKMEAVKKMALIK